MLYIDGGVYVDAAIEDLLDVLVPLGMATVRGVRVGEFID